MAELAEKTGYSSEQALSRAFKKYFNLPPKAFKKIFFKEVFGDVLSPRICKVALKNIVTLCNPLGNKENWQKLYMYAIVNRLLSESTESIEIIEGKKYIPAITTDRLLESNRHTATLILPEGLYAIFTYKGNTAYIPELYAAIHNYWLPMSKYTQSKGMPYVIYLNSPAMVSIDNLLAEVYIPLTEK